MSDRKISALSTMLGSLVDLASDYLPFIDADQADASKNKRITVNELRAAILSAPNYLINPSGEINQGGLGAGTDGVYDFDQWVVLTQTAAVTPSQLTDVENATPFMMRLLQAQASAQRFGRIQWLEKARCRELRGQTVVLSGRARCSASTTLRYAIVEWTGTADTITKDIVNDWTSGTFTTGNFFTSTSTTVVATGSIALAANTLTDLTELTGAVSGSMNNLAVFLWTDSTQAQNVTLDIAKVKLEKGAIATQFVPRPFDEELRSCRRYWESSYPLGTAPGSASSIGVFKVVSSNTVTTGMPYGTESFNVLKRVVPTVTMYGLAGTSGRVSNYTGTELAASSGTPNETSEREFNGNNGNAGSVTTTGNIVRFHYAADARL